ncbi:unnamed protein product [Lymnaea stagnalis]|uniref:Uncharacterized protein n=1 Tax=Lymnaea stagnalis TaxID=6523 RepID=A0AAV2H3C5_LYMST
MFEITGTLRLLLLLVVLSHLPVCSGWDVDATRLSLKLVFYEKSCSDGMVAHQDYFILKGLMNITKLEGGQRADIAIFYIDRRRQNEWIVESTVKLEEVTCRDLNHVKIDTCSCTSMDTNYVRIMCNLTAKIVYSRTYLSLCFVNGGKYTFSPSFKMPPVYGTPVCLGPSVNRAAKSHPESFSAVLGIALLGSAVVCLASSLISQM